MHTHYLTPEGAAGRRGRRHRVGTGGEDSGASGETTARSCMPVDDDTGRGRRHRVGTGGEDSGASGETTARSCMPLEARACNAELLAVLTQEDSYSRVPQLSNSCVLGGSSTLY
jgi:hypothetical protein